MKRLIAALLIAAPLAASAESHPEAKRVIALGGSVTEIIYALGAQDRLVARDTTSSFPAEALALTDVGYVRALSPEGVLSVGPELILAEEGAGPPEAIDVLKTAGIPYVEVPEAYSPEGIVEKIEIVSTSLGVVDQGAAVTDALKADLDKVAALNASVEQPKKVLFILSLQGGRVMAGGQGTAADAIIKLAGAENALQGVEGYKPITDEAITSAAPDVILMMQRGDDKADAKLNGGDGAGGAKDAALKLPALKTTPAAENDAFVMMNGLLLLGFGPRTGQAALQLHEAIYGDA